ncbi:MAG: hypothetical protein IT326_08965 [Anaerolineae bacterium]|nr:hypothetical protein [Anaerolineae bacterium]
MKTPLSYHDLIEHLPHTGCVICNLGQREVSRHLDALLYEFVNDIETHALFRAARGLCNQHAWQFMDFQGHILGVAILYKASIDEVLKIIERAESQGAAKNALKKLIGGNVEGKSGLSDELEPRAPCTACKALTEAEHLYAKTLSETLTDPRIGAAFRESSGLCLPHLRLVLRYVEDEAKVRLLLDIQTEKWNIIRADLQRFIEMYDYQRSSERMGPERDSPLRGIRSMSGEDGVFGLRR